MRKKIAQKQQQIQQPQQQQIQQPQQQLQPRQQSNIHQPKTTQNQQIRKQQHKSQLQKQQNQQLQQISDYRIKNQALCYIYNSLNLEQSHFVVVIVDVSERKVLMIKPLNKTVDPNHVLAGKWIAKIFSIMDYYINQDNENVGEKGIYLGNKNMATDEMVEQINSADMENKYTSYIS